MTQEIKLPIEVGTGDCGDAVLLDGNSRLVGGCSQLEYIVKCVNENESLHARIKELGEENNLLKEKLNHLVEELDCEWKTLDKWHEDEGTCLFLFFGKEDNLYYEGLFTDPMTSDFPSEKELDLLQVFYRKVSVTKNDFKLNGE